MAVKKRDDVDMPDGDEDDADDRAIEEVREVEKAERRPRREEPEDDDEPDDEDDSEEQDDDEPDEDTRPTRKERRSNRYREMQDELRAVRAQLASMQQPPAAQAQSDDGPSDEEINSEYTRLQSDHAKIAMHYDARRQVLAQSNLSMTQEEEQGFLRQVAEIERKKGELITLSVARKYGYRPAQNVDPFASYVKTKYYDVQNDVRGRRYVFAAYNEALADGEEDGPALLEKCYKKARAKLRGGQERKSPKPSASTQAKYTGTSSGARKGGNDGPTVIRLSKEERRMADALYGHIKDDNKRYIAYHKNVQSQKDE